MRWMQHTLPQLGMCVLLNGHRPPQKEEIEHRLSRRLNTHGATMVQAADVPLKRARACPVTDYESGWGRRTGGNREQESKGA